MALSFDIVFMSVLCAEAVRTYNSAAGTEKLKISGKYEAKCVQQRRRNRLKRVCVPSSCWSCIMHMSCVAMQKLTARQVALEKSTSTSAKGKQRWRECLVEELISSEDSEEDGSFLIRPLPWRSEKVDKFIYSLDQKLNKKRSKKSKMMTFGRKAGPESHRAKPPTGSVPTWAVRS